MDFPFEQSSLWQRALASRKKDQHEKEREALRSAFIRMRALVADLVSSIPEGCRGLTVHDVSHLDALWEIADLTAGEDYELNPAEAFVFGASVLLHDAGMSV